MNPLQQLSHDVAFSGLGARLSEFAYSSSNPENEISVNDTIAESQLREQVLQLPQDAKVIIPLRRFHDRFFFNSFGEQPRYFRSQSFFFSYFDTKGSSNRIILGFRGTYFDPKIEGQWYRHPGVPIKIKDAVFCQQDAPPAPEKHSSLRALGWWAMHPRQLFFGALTVATIPPSLLFVYLFSWALVPVAGICELGAGVRKLVTKGPESTVPIPAKDWKTGRKPRDILEAHELSLDFHSLAGYVGYVEDPKFVEKVTAIERETNINVVMEEPHD